MQRLKITSCYIAILLSISSFCFGNNLKDSLAIAQLKLGYAYQNGIDKDMDYLFGIKRVESQLYKEFESNYPVCRVGRAPIKEKKYLIEMLYRPLYQRMDRQKELQEVNLVDSLYQEFYKSGDLNRFHQYVLQYSYHSEAKWITQFYETDVFYNVLKNLPLGGISQPFTTAKGIYVVHKIEEKEAPIFCSTAFEMADINNAFLKYHIVQRGKDIQNGDQLSNTIIYETPFKNYTRSDYDEFAKASIYGDRQNWSDFKALVLRETIEKYLKQNKDFLGKLEERRDQILIELAFNHYLQVNNIDLAQLKKKYQEGHLNGTQLNYAQFKGLIVFSNKKRQLKLLDKTIEQLPIESWVGVIESINKSKKKPVFNFFYGETLVLDNELTNEYYIKGLGLSEKKRRKEYKKFLIKGELNLPEVDQDLLDDIAITEVRNRVDKEWIKSLKSGK